MDIGDVVVTTQNIGGWSREATPAGRQGTVVQTSPLVARFFLGNSDYKTYDIALHPGEWR